MNINDVNDSHGTSQFSIIIFFNISKPWMEAMKSASHLSLWNEQCCPTLTEHVWQTARSHAAHQSLCPSWTDCINPIWKESRVLYFVPAKRWWPATISFWSWGPPLTPQWQQCLSDVWVHLQGVVSLCECAIPAPEKERMKKNERICWQWKRWALNKEWTGGYAWINAAAQMQADGRALLIPCRTKKLRWLKQQIPGILCLRSPSVRLGKC